MKIIDLTHTITHNMQVYPGDTPPVLNQSHSLASDGYTDHQLTTGMHTGTHIDGPWHMVDNNCHISDLPMNNFMGKACVIDISHEKEFNNIQHIREKAKDCTIVLFHTGYGQLFGTGKYMTGYPLIGNEIAEEMVALGIKLVGIDTVSPDIAPYQAHKTLLGKGVLIAENLANLHLLLDIPAFQVIALPMKIAADSALARIIALVET